MYNDFMFIKSLRYKIVKAKVMPNLTWSKRNVLLNSDCLGVIFVEV